MDKLKFEGIAMYANLVTPFQHKQAKEAKYTLTVLLNRQLQAPFIAQLDEIQNRIMTDICKGAPWRSDMFTIYEVLDDQFVSVPLSSSMQYWSPMVNISRADGQSITPELDSDVIGQLVVVSASAGGFGSPSEERSAIGVRMYMNAVYATGNPSGIDMSAYRGGLDKTFNELAEMAATSVYAGASPAPQAPPATPPAPQAPAYTPPAPPSYAPPATPQPPQNAWPVDQYGRPIPPEVPSDPGLTFD